MHTIREVVLLKIFFASEDFKFIGQTGCLSATQPLSPCFRSHRMSGFCVVVVLFLVTHFATLRFSKEDDHTWVHIQKRREAVWGLEHHFSPVSPESLPENSFHCPPPCLLKSGRDPSLYKKQLSEYYNIRTWRKSKRKNTVSLFKTINNINVDGSAWMFVPNIALPAIPKAVVIRDALWLMQVL